MTNECLPTSWGGPEIKYLLQGECGGRAAHWLTPQGLWVPNLCGELCLDYMTNVGIVAHVPGQESSREQGGAYVSGVYLSSGLSHPLSLTKFPGMIYCPTVPPFLFIKEQRYWSDCL